MGAQNAILSNLALCQPLDVLTSLDFTPHSSLMLHVKEISTDKTKDYSSTWRGSEQELQQLTERLQKTAAGYGTETSSNKSKILVNSTKPYG